MSEEEDTDVDEAQIPRINDHKGGKINRFELITTRELMASPLTISCFYETLISISFPFFMHHIPIHIPKTHISHTYC